MAAAAQYLAVPIFLMTLVLLLHKASPTGTGICAVVRSFAKLDNSQLATTIYSAAHTNTSALAFEKAAHPYLKDALQALVGEVIRVVPNDKIAFDQLPPAAARTTVPLQAFLLKMSDIYTLPASTAVSLAKSFICVHSLLWFVLYLLALLAWMYYPQCFVVVPPAPIAVAATTPAEEPTSAEAKKNE